MLINCGLASERVQYKHFQDAQLQIFIYLGDVSSWTSSHVSLIKEELLAATAMESDINRTLVIKRITEGSTCAFELLSHLEATSCL